MNISITWFGRLMPALATLIVGLVFLNVAKTWGPANGAAAAAAVALLFVVLCAVGWTREDFFDDAETYPESRIVDDFIIAMGIMASVSTWMVLFALGASLFVAIVTAAVLAIGLLFVAGHQDFAPTKVLSAHLFLPAAAIVGFMAYSAGNLFFAEVSFVVILLIQVVIAWIGYRRQPD